MDNANGGVDVNATAIDAAIAKLGRHTMWQRKMQPQKRGGAMALATCDGAIWKKAAWSERRPARPAPTKSNGRGQFYKKNGWGLTKTINWLGRPKKHATTAWKNACGAFWHNFYGHWDTIGTFVFVFCFFFTLGFPSQAQRFHSFLVPNRTC